MSSFETCPTAPHKTFGSLEEYKAHYRSEWHRYNLRRKIAGLDMVTEDEFEARRNDAKQAAANQRTRDSYSHVKPSKREAHRKKLETRGMVTDPAGATIKDSVAAYRSNVVSSQARLQAVETNEEKSSTNEEKIVNLEEETPIVAEVRSSDSIFDSKRFADVSAALEYMQKTYGFLLPEVEYLVDVDGCVLYLCEKVKNRRTCLYCGRVFRSFAACQQHMIDKGHCKVPYDTDDQVAELSSFYDFSRSYDAYDSDDVDKVLDLDTDDRNEEDEDDVWEDIDDVPEGGTNGPLRRPLPQVRVMESGELLVQHGHRRKIVGARWLRRYYKQNYRLNDERTATLAVQKEQTARVVTLYKDAGVLAKSDGFFARGLAAQFNKRAIAGVAKRDSRMQARQQMMNIGMQSGRAKYNTANSRVKHQTAGKNRGEGTGVHG